MSQGILLNSFSSQMHVFKKNKGDHKRAASLSCLQGIFCAVVWRDSEKTALGCGKWGALGSLLPCCPQDDSFGANGVVKIMDLLLPCATFLLTQGEGYAKESFNISKLHASWFVFLVTSREPLEDAQNVKAFSPLDLSRGGALLRLSCHTCMWRTS